MIRRLIPALIAAAALLASPLAGQAPIAVDTLTLEPGQQLHLVVQADSAPRWPAEPGPSEPEPEPEPPAPPVTPTRTVGLFAYALPLEEIGALWTSGVEVVSKDLPAKAAAAAARGGRLIGAQGTYKKFQAVNPKTGKLEYQPAVMDRWIESHRPYIAELVRLQQAGALGPIQIADDFASTERWPPAGISVAELSRIARQWKALHPDIELALRARPRQFTGEVPAGISVVIVQFRYWGLGNETPAQFRDRELALADARGWDVIWSMNFLNGGGMVNGKKQPMTAQQIRETGLAFAAVKKRNRGVGGWMYDRKFMQRPDVQAAFRDVVAALRKAA